MEPQKMDTTGEEKLQITDDAKIIVQLERDEDKKRKRAHEDVVRNNLSISSHILTHKYLLPPSQINWTSGIQNLSKNTCSCKSTKLTALGLLAHSIRPTSGQQ